MWTIAGRMYYNRYIVKACYHINVQLLPFDFTDILNKLHYSLYRWNLEVSNNSMYNAQCYVKKGNKLNDTCLYSLR